MKKFTIENSQPASQLIRALVSLFFTFFLFQCKDNSKIISDKIASTQNKLGISQDYAKKLSVLAFDREKKTQNTENAKLSLSNEKEFSEIDTFKDEDGNDIFHIVNYKNITDNSKAGWVIVSADRRLQPILAYSDVGKFQIDTLEKGIDIWVNIIEQQLKKAKEKLTKPNKNIEELWKNYDSKLLVKGGRVNCPYYDPNCSNCPPNTYYSTGILVNSTWNQNAVYNHFGPQTSCYTCEKAPAGCGPVAIAQVWNYYSKPTSYNTYIYPYGGGNYSYPLPASRSGNICDFAQFTSADRQIGILIRNAGTAASSSYMYLGSCNTLTNRPDVKTAFQNVGYSNSGTRIDFNNNNNLQAVKNELTGLHPIIIDGNTSFNFSDWHIWVMDGYTENEYWYLVDPNNPSAGCNGYGYSYYHLNWGHGGTNDGWYGLNNFYDGNDLYDYALNVTLGMRP